MSEWNPKITTKRLKTAGAFFSGHFVLTKGNHSNFYIDCAQALRDPILCDFLGSTIAKQLIAKGVQADVIVSPAENAIPLGQLVARRMGRLHNSYPAPRAVIASKDEEEGFVFKRGGEKEVVGKKIVVVEDLWSTGGSTKRVVELIRECGGEVTAVVAIVNRGNVEAKDLGDPPTFFSLTSVDGVPFPKNACPLCADQMPMNKTPGHGTEWLKDNPEYPVS